MESNKTEKGPESDDFLTKVLRLHEEQPQSFGMEDVLMTCSANVVAGSDTTSISLSGIMWGLIKNPEAMEKVRRIQLLQSKQWLTLPFSKLRTEVDEKLAKGEISDPITFADAQKMPYLQAVIQEGLRTHPATGLPLGRVVPEGGVRIAERFFPKGVSANVWGTFVSLAPGKLMKQQNRLFWELILGWLITTKTFLETMPICSDRSAGSLIRTRCIRWEHTFFP